MRHGDQYPIGTPAFNVASYDKKATILAALRGLLGERLFMQAYREYGRRWVNKHPTPWDFWNTFNDVTRRDLSWFWRTWYWETWILDQAIESVTQVGNIVQITVADRGLAPMPVRLAITYDDGRVQREEVAVENWLSGARRFVAQTTVRGVVSRVEIDPEHEFPDINRDNQVWTRR
jgi:aminopeptidase N